MKRLFLASSIQYIARAIRAEINLEKPKLIFITTASEGESGEKAWLTADRQALVDEGFAVDDYSITGKSASDIDTAFNSYDCVCFEGGNTFYLLQEIQKTKCADVILRQVAAGKIYIGSSAGSMVAGEDIAGISSEDQREDAPELRGTEGLGLVDISIMPHWGTPKRTDKIRRKFEDMYAIPERKLILLSDSQYIRVVGDMYKIIEI